MLPIGRTTHIPTDIDYYSLKFKVMKLKNKEIRNFEDFKVKSLSTKTLENVKGGSGSVIILDQDGQTEP